MENAEQIKLVLVKVLRLVSYVRHSTVASDLFEGENRLQAANATRWNSQLTMLKSLLQVCDSDAMQRLNYTGKLNAYEITVIKRTWLKYVLTPFKWATDLTQGQNIVTVSYIVRGLKVQIDHHFINEWKNTTLKRFSGLLLFWIQDGKWDGARKMKQQR